MFERHDPKNEPTKDEVKEKMTKMIDRIMESKPSFESQNRFEVLADKERDTAEIPVADPRWSRRSERRGVKFSIDQCTCIDKCTCIDTCKCIDKYTCVDKCTCINKCTCIDKCTCTDKWGHRLLFLGTPFSFRHPLFFCWHPYFF